MNSSNIYESPRSDLNNQQGLRATPNATESSVYRRLFLYLPAITVVLFIFTRLANIQMLQCNIWTVIKALTLGYMILAVVSYRSYNRQLGFHLIAWGITIAIISTVLGIMNYLSYYIINLLHSASFFVFLTLIFIIGLFFMNKMPKIKAENKSQ